MSVDQTEQEQPANRLPRLTIGSWKLDATSQRLVRGRQYRRLNPKEFSVLTHLAEAAPEAVSTDALLERSWSGRVVSDDAVYQVIRRLRRALDDDARHSTYIETLPKRGYRLIADVADDEPPEPRSSSAPSVTLLVLPFEASSGDRHLADGVTFEIQGNLSKLKDLRLVSRRAVVDLLEQNQSPSEICRRLGADAYLEGNIVKRGNTVRVTALLNEVASSTQLWSGAYQKTVNDLLELQAELALAISEGLCAKITAPELSRVRRLPTRNVAAQQLVRRSRHLGGGHPGENAAGIELLEQAIALDPGYAEAHAWLAWRLGWAVWTGDLDQRARLVETADRALSLDPECGWCHYARGQAEAVLGGPGAAIVHLLRARELEPSGELILVDLCHYLARNGQLEEALGFGIEGCRLNLNDANIRWHASVPLQLLDLPDHAREWLRTAAERFPEDPGRFRCMLGLMQLDLLAGDTDSARMRAFKVVAKVQPHIAEAMLPAAEVLLCLGEWDAAMRALEVILRSWRHVRSYVTMSCRTAAVMYAFCLLSSGDGKQAIRYLNESLSHSEQVTNSNCMADWLVERVAVCSLLEKHEVALEWLEQAYARGYRHYRLLELDPMLASIRCEPRFQTLIDRMKVDVRRMATNVERAGFLATLRRIQG